MRRFTWMSWLLLLLSFAVSADEDSQLMRVGLKSAPPFAMQDEQGREWQGLSVELWKKIAQENNWRTEWVPMTSIGELVDNLESGNIDVAVGALSMTPEREERIDFSHSFFHTGLAIATPVQQSGWLALLGQLASPAFLSAVGFLGFLILAAGAALWLVERKHNPEQFGGSLVKGIGHGFWWSAVTMTTVGYGDKAPVTRLGRILATFWMFFSVITISSFTAAIASSVTLNELKTAVNDISDLSHVRALVVPGSTGEEALQARRYSTRGVATAEQGVEQLLTRNSDAFVYDKAILQYLLRDSPVTVELLDFPDRDQNYAFGLRQDFADIESINRHVLDITRSKDWQLIQQKYFGSSDTIN